MGPRICYPPQKWNTLNLELYIGEFKASLFRPRSSVFFFGPNCSCLFKICLVDTGVEWKWNGSGMEMEGDNLITAESLWPTPSDYDPNDPTFTTTPPPPPAPLPCSHPPNHSPGSPPGGPKRLLPRTRAGRWRSGVGTDLWGALSPPLL